MQHTTKYQLNLIDPSDEFLPDPLNQNMEAVEAQLQAREAAEKALDSKFTAAVGTKGKTCRIAYGSYKGSSNSGPSVTVDFKPYIICAGSQGNSVLHIMCRPCTKSGGSLSGPVNVIWNDHGASWSGSNSAVALNEVGVTYYYVALGVDE